MSGEVSPEQARKILDMLTEGKALDNVNTTLALRLVPIAEELDDEELVGRLLEPVSYTHLTLPTIYSV